MPQTTSPNVDSGAGQLVHGRSVEPDLHGAGRGACRAVREQPCIPVAEVQLALGETGRVAEQARHGMAHPFRVLEAFAQHHVATAFAVHRTRSRK